MASLAERATERGRGRRLLWHARPTTLNAALLTVQTGSPALSLRLQPAFKEEPDAVQGVR